MRQHPIAIDDGIVVHADLAYLDAGLVVEVDHRAWHSGAQAALDKRRDRQVLLASGLHTTRVTDDDLAHRFDATVAEVVELYRSGLRATNGGRQPPVAEVS